MNFDLQAAARRTAIQEGFEPDFSPAVRTETAALTDDLPSTEGTTDLRALPWSSIDNPESRDLDQVEYAERLPAGGIRILVGIADVDSRVPRDSATDQRAAHNATSVYCGVTMFPMLPERLSTGLTSLNERVDRLVVVIEFTVQPDGTTKDPKVYRALLQNQAQLDYPSVGAWLEGHGPAPSKVAASPTLAEQLRIQDEAAVALRNRRHLAGALDLETIEATPVTTDGKVTDLKVHLRNRATMLIEDFMIEANVTMAGFLDAKHVSSIRRVVKAPERWNRIVALAKAVGESLPDTPDAVALTGFLTRRRAADPDHFPDLSVSVVKLMGPGEYALQKPGGVSQGHFGLAVHDYTHSTAPNRRFADLVTQRLLKGVLATGSAGYTDDALAGIAAQCTRMEDAARKVERTSRKQAAALLLADRIGQTFDAIVTGANPKGTFVRALALPVEGMVVHGQEGMDVGDRVRVRLTGADPNRGFIDFVRA